jgi:hypothetical protein
VTKSKAKFKAVARMVARLPRKRESTIISMVNTVMSADDDDSTTSHDDAISEGEEEEDEDEDIEPSSGAGSAARRKLSSDELHSGREASLTTPTRNSNSEPSSASSNPSRRLSATAMLFGSLHEKIEDESPLPANVTERRTRNSHEELQDVQRKSLDMLFEKMSVTDNPMMDSKKAKKKPRPSFYGKSEAYMEAMASDSINEVHPERLGAFFQGSTAATGSTFGEFPKERVKPDQALGRVEEFQQLLQAATIDAPSISVKDLRSRYLSNADGRSRSGSKAALSDVEVPEAGTVKNLLANWKNVTNPEDVEMKEGKSKKGPVVFESSVTESGGVSALRERFNSRSNSTSSKGPSRKSSSVSRSSSVSELTEGWISTDPSRNSSRHASQEAVTMALRTSDSSTSSGTVAGGEAHRNAHESDKDDDNGTFASVASVFGPSSAAESPEDFHSVASKPAPSSSSVSNAVEESSGDAEKTPKVTWNDLQANVDSTGSHDTAESEDAVEKRRTESSASSVSDTSDIIGSVRDRRSTMGSTASAPSVLFQHMEILALKLMFSLFDRKGTMYLDYDDLVAYAEETGDMMAIRDASMALEILDIDGDGRIGLLDFINFAARLKAAHQRRLEEEMMDTHSIDTDASDGQIQDQGEANIQTHTVTF